VPDHHKGCNAEHSTIDQKIAQLIGLRWGKPLSSKRDRQLDIKVLGPGFAAVTNLNIDAAVMRWVRAFHAALYREPLLSFRHALVTPFPTATGVVPAINPIKDQHLAYVQTIKEQRALRNLDSITSNKGKLTYECVWAQTDQRDRWLCVFALNFYDWKDLGRTPGQPVRGCAGFYVLPTKLPAPGATLSRSPPILIPNVDVLDPFAP
jgi:hypothetical protein